MDELERRRVVAEAESRLFGGTPAAVSVGRFRLRSLLGTGGLGVVWAAHDPGLDRLVAVKVLHARGSDESLFREARSLAKLSHPNVVHVYEVGEHDGRMFVAMELVDGWTLRTWIQETRPSRRAVVDALRQAGLGLAAAHAAGLVHRDFKPENVLVGRDGRVRVVDFGLARVAAADPRTTGVAGTAAYMAPEQHRGIATAASDQYAFCVVAREVLAEVLGKEAPRALSRGVAVRPEDRFPSMEAAIAALDPAWRRKAAVAFVSLAILVALAAAILQTIMFSAWFRDLPER